MEKMSRPRIINTEGYKSSSSTGDHRERIAADERAIENSIGNDEFSDLEDSLLNESDTNKVYGHRMGQSHLPKREKPARDTIRYKEAA